MTADIEWWAMLIQFNIVLNSMAHVAAILCVFSIVWAAIVLMAEGAEERNAGRAKAALWTSIVGLALVLSAKILVSVLVAAAPDL